MCKLSKWFVYPVVAQGMVQIPGLSKLEKVLLVPQLKHNLLSVKCLTEKFRHLMIKPVLLKW